MYLLFGEDQIERQIFVAKADTTGLGKCRFSIAGITAQFIKHLLAIPVASYLDGAHWRSEEKDASELPKLENLSEYDIVNTLNELSAQLASDPAFFRSILFYLKNHDESTHENTLAPIQVPEFALSKVCLFTRSADSYIFPYSQKNKGKHIADGHALFKWWVNVLNGVLDESWKCKADLPGSDSRAVGRFLPDRANWSVGSIYDDENPQGKAVRTIPLFPDDPKGRFLEHLIVENRYKSVTTSQFWNELGFRQEFRLGNVVGIISCSQAGPERLLAQNGENDACITLRQYKKLMEVIKGEDFSESDDVSVLTNSTLPELLEQMKVGGCCVTVSGTKVYDLPKAPVANGATKVNNLSGMVKHAKSGQKRAVGSAIDESAEKSKKRVAVNNLTGLVRRK